MFYCRFDLFCVIQVILAHGVHLLRINCDFFGYSGEIKIDTDFQYQMRYNTSVTTQNIKMLRYERI